MSDLEHLGDFTVHSRMVKITLWAIPVGLVSAGLAWALLRLIGLITNAVFYGRLNTRLVAPGAGSHHSALLVLLAPVAGGLIVGAMARFGSEKIRGHGMPEAIEAILIGGSRVQPRVAVLKPISAAITIGTGGPFGAEGPIIMTGGAAGSILAQYLNLSADERKTLLVAGAVAGMAATFNSPLASVLLAVELLLFEWRPRSFVPVAAAVATSTVARWPLLGHGPLFGLPPVHVTLHPGVVALCIVPGVTGGLLAIIATGLVYASEDTFGKLRLHWMWWPAIGGAIIGIGGLIEPRALGVGYDVIGQLLRGHAGISLIIGILIVKTAIWSLSLGSGTSGGVLAPTFMIGASLGALEGHALPAVLPGFWALAGLAAVLGGVMRSPLTGVVFPLELTHAWPLLVPLLISSTAAYALSALLLKRSVLTEKVARRGLHLTREYSVDPLEVLLVGEVMRAPGPPLVAADGQPAATAAAGEPADETGNGRPAPAADRDAVKRTAPAATRPAGSPEESPECVFVDDTLRDVANRFAVQGASWARVAERAAPERTIGVVTLADLLEARLRDHREEHYRERVLRLRRWARWRSVRAHQSRAQR